MNKHDMANALYSAMNTQAFRDRLAAIHKHYPNLKCEERYRDALLEAFNEDGQRKVDELIAYAEDGAVDLVVCPKHGWEENRLRVEMKYQFTFDFYHRVSGELGREERKQGDLARILKDCRDPDCDMFILFVQDRRGATHGEAIKTAKYADKHERGIRLQFLNNQNKFDKNVSEAEYERAWLTPVRGLFERVAESRTFRELDRLGIQVPSPLRPNLPLQSHVFTLVF